MDDSRYFISRAIEMLRSGGDLTQVITLLAFAKDKQASEKASENKEQQNGKETSDTQVS